MNLSISYDNQLYLRKALICEEIEVANLVLELLEGHYFISTVYQVEAKIPYLYS
jgi:hypothetical protein